MGKIAYIGKFKKSSTSTEESVVDALRALGHDVTCVDYLTDYVPRYSDKDYALAIFSKCEPLRSKVIKEFQCKKAMWIFDSLHDTTMQTLRLGAEEMIEKGKLMDRLFTAAPGDIKTYHDSGCKNASYLPQACDDRIFFDRNLNRDLDITFVGNNYGGHRAEIIRQVYKRYGNKFKLFSKTDTWGVPVEKALTQEGMAEVFSRSKLTLNMSETPEDDKWSRRVWDAMGCGAVMVAQYCPSYERFFDEDEIVTWRDVQDLFGKMDALLENPEQRKKISLYANGLIHEHHTYKRRVKELLSQMGLET